MKYKKNNNLSVMFLMLCFCVVLNSCISVGPNYKAPKLQQPDFSVQDLSGDDNETVEMQNISDWWNLFNDELMKELITQSLSNAPDIHEALARVREARARLGISRSDYFPKINAEGDFSRTRLGKDADGTGYNNIYRAGLDAAWEVDIFGGVRRATEAAGAMLDMETANLHDVWLSLAAETALNYIEIRTFQKRLLVARKNLKAQEETLKILSSRYDAGLIDALDVSQARYNLEASRSEIPLLNIGLENRLNALSVLLGAQPGTLHQHFDEVQAVPVPLDREIIGICAEVLRRRPDIKKAERRLAAESARIGEAVARLYPAFSLAGFFGTQAVHSGELFTAGAGSRSIVPGVIWPVFQAGELKNQVRAQTAVKDRYLAIYEKIVLSAVAEVRDALTGYVQESSRMVSLTNAVQAAEKAVEIAEDKYRNGITDFNNVLDAQRSLLTLEDKLALSQGNTSAYMVRIYKALGGGWALFNSNS